MFKSLAVHHNIVSLWLLQALKKILAATVAFRGYGMKLLVSL